MNRSSIYYFRFGYESPVEAESNDKHGTDFESSLFFAIEAASEEQALDWGKVVADRIVQRMFNDPEPGRWSRANFAAWIETEASQDLIDASKGMLIVKASEMPDLSGLRVGRK